MTALTIYARSGRVRLIARQIVDYTPYEVDYESREVDYAQYEVDYE
jgi:hypothetical protein